MFGEIDASLLASFNPYVELLKAREIRDALCRRFVLKPAALQGRPTRELAQAGQDALAGALHQRGWSDPMIAAYLASP